MLATAASAAGRGAGTMRLPAHHPEMAICGRPHLAAASATGVATLSGGPNTTQGLWPPLQRSCGPRTPCHATRRRLALCAHVSRAPLAPLRTAGQRVNAVNGVNGVSSVKGTSEGIFRLGFHLSPASPLQRRRNLPLDPVHSASVESSAASDSGDYDVEAIAEVDAEAAPQISTEAAAVESSGDAAPLGAPSEAPPAAPLEASLETSLKSPSEASSSEASLEATSEASSEAPSEASLEAPSEASSEAPSEASSEAPSEASSEAPSEASSEAPSELPSAEASADTSPPEPPTASHAAPSSSPSSGDEDSLSPPSHTFNTATLGGDTALLGYTVGGPLLEKVGLGLADVEETLEEWVALAGLLAQQLGFDLKHGLSYSELGRIFHYYLPVYMWCKRQLAEHRAKALAEGLTPHPLVIGISAPQGCGKTTVVESLEYLFQQQGIEAASISIDDFYLTNKEQNELAVRHPGNKLLELRGNAGSHDLALAEETLEALLAATSAESKVPLPRYDKSAFSGRGDRAPAEAWPVAEGPLDVVLLEGWMLGFTPLPEDQVAAVSSQLLPVNQSLAAYEKLHSFVDSWIVIRVRDPDWVYQWRLQAEVRMRASGRPGMTDEEVADFVSRYMPAYKAYLGKLYSEGPPHSDPEHLLVLSVDRSRNPTR